MFGGGGGDLVGMCESRSRDSSQEFWFAEALVISCHIVFAALNIRSPIDNLHIALPFHSSG